MSYKVIKRFKDADGKLYEPNAPYSIDGITEERLAVLSTKGNKYGYPFIEKMEQGKDPDFKLEDLPTEEVKEYTNDEIKARLDELGIEHKANDNKDKLIERLFSKVGDE